MKQISVRKYQKLFNQIIRQRYGRDADFASIERQLAELRRGPALSYGHLEIIADEAYWPFKKYWMWPAKDKIIDKLKETKGLFVDPLSKYKGENKESWMICHLLEIFKNLSLVSIVLRFVWPKYYAIYSRPNLWILRVERGASDLEEYMNYLRVMRLLKQTFKVKRTADVDMVVWAAAKEDNASKKFLDFLSKSLPAEMMPLELIKNIYKNPLNISSTFLAKKDYKTSAFWSSQAFELLIIKEYFRLIFPRWRNWNKGELEDMIDQLCEKQEYKNMKGKLHRLRILRNKAVHPDKSFNENEAIELFEGIRKLNEKVKLFESNGVYNG